MRFSCRSVATALVAAVVLLAPAGCVVRQGDFTVLSTKLIRTSNFDLSGADRVRGVQGEDMAHIIFIIPTKQNPNIEDAIDNALEKENGDVMTDVVVESYSWYIPYIYGRAGWRVQGDVVRTRK